MNDDPRIEALRGWIVDQGLASERLDELIGGFGERALALGLPLCRAFLGMPSIDPIRRSMSVIWQPGEAARLETIQHGENLGQWEESPLFFMLTNDIVRRRWRIEDPAVAAEFPLFAEMRRDGCTDYAAQVVGFTGGRTPALRGIALTGCTARPGGFTDSDLATLNALVPSLALASYRITVSDMAARVLGAYVGHDAAARILDGEIVRGEGHRVESALLFADLSGFTAVADASGEGLVGRLGEHLAAITEPIEAAGGEILKFMGDGVLAGFAIEGDGGAGRACTALLAAAREAICRNDGVNARFGHNTPLGLDIALHRGEVFYGNVGGGTRLDFTVIGPAVNETSRIERLCGELGEPLLMSEAFATCCGAALRDLGRHALRGVAEARLIYAPA